jgi:Ca-activated chloride channel family protein
MSYEHPWVLLLAILPLLWVLREWRNSARRAALCLKAAGLAAVLIALAEPRLETYESKVAAGILVDTSASLTAQDLARASEIFAQIEGARGSRWSRVIPFARSARNVGPTEHGGSWKLQYTSGDAGRATNLEAALRDGAASLPAGLVPRLVLISDGNENLGSVVRGAWQARELGIPVDTFPLAGRPKPNLRLESTSLPSQVFSGERFPIDISLSSPRRAKVTVEISAEGKTLGSNQVEIEPGINHFRVHASVSTSGAVDLAGKISAPDLGDARFEQAVTLRKPQVLLITQDPPGTETHLTKTLEANQFEIRRSPNGPPDDLTDIQLIVFNNWNVDSLSAPQKVAVEEFVKQGGGLLWIGGDRNVYVENKTEDPVERTLPAKLAPPRTPEGTCVVLIVDKSSSMEGKKMELARLAAMGVIENLRPIDMVGVLIFDNSFQWTVPIRRAVDRETIKRLVAGIAPDGGTQIAPAVAEAFRRIVPVNAVYKHIVLLTDGISEEGDSLMLAREAAQNRVTISTVGLGQDVNRAYLEKIATLSNGKSHFLIDPSGLEQILLKDVIEHTGSTAVEKPVAPMVARQAEILSGVGMDTAPSLRGYVRFIAKPTAETILTVDTEKDPLLVRWQYELGRAAVFASDAKSRWAANWITWPGYDKFWTNVFRDLLPHAAATEATAEYDSANDELVVNYRLGRHVEEPAVIPDIYVFGPNGFQRPVKASKLASGSFRVQLGIGRRQGLFRVRPLVESRAFPEIGLYRQEDEMTDYGSNDFVLRQISASTGGRFNPNPKDVFDPGGRSIPSVMELWPGLLALAVLLNLIELVMRKGKSLFARA